MSPLKGGTDEIFIMFKANGQMEPPIAGEFSHQVISYLIKLEMKDKRKLIGIGTNP